MKTIPAILLAFAVIAAHAADPLPSWNDGKAKQSIVTFVEKVTKEGSPEFVPVPERIAGFNGDRTDHTLHAESTASHAKAAQLHAEAASAHDKAAAC
jgi:hypothetical protein